MDGNRLTTIHETGQVIRYHANPKFNRLTQTNGDHTWGVVAIIFALHPDPSLNLIKAAHFHDAGELFAGDLSYPFKKAHPDIAELHAERERELAVEAGIPGMELPLESVDYLWLELADRLESFMFARLFRPEEAAEWLNLSQTHRILELAIFLECQTPIKEILYG